MDWDILILLATFAAGLAFYFVPTIVAMHRSHPHALFIFLVNLTFGITVIGWIGPLVWALITPGTISIAVPVAVRWQPADMRCPACGGRVSAAAVTCRSCGRSLS